MAEEDRPDLEDLLVGEVHRQKQANDARGFLLTAIPWFVLGLTGVSVAAVILTAVLRPEDLRWVVTALITGQSAQILGVSVIYAKYLFHHPGSDSSSDDE